MFFCLFVYCIFRYDLYINVFLPALKMISHKIDPEFVVQHYIGIYTRGIKKGTNIVPLISINCIVYDQKGEPTVKLDQQFIDNLIKKNTKSERGNLTYTNITFSINNNSKSDYIFYYPLQNGVYDIGSK